MSSTAVFLSGVIARLENLRGKCGDEVGENVGKLRGYLEEVRGLLGDRTQNVEFNNQVIRIAYDIENAVERQVITLEKGSKNASLFTSCCTGKTHLANFRHNIKTRIQNLKFYPATPKVVAPASSEVDTSVSRCKICGQQENQLDDTGTFGLKEQMEHLWTKLPGNSRGLTQIAITGMAGIGKSALAWKIFSDAKVKNEFDVRAWVCVSRDSRIKDVLVSLLLDIDKTFMSRDQLLGFEIPKLNALFTEKLKSSQKGFFIVFDGVLSTQLWDGVRDIFQEYRMGSNVVIITTREEELAHYQHVIEHKVPPLARKDSQDLFIKRSQVRFPENISENASLQNTMNIILRMCQDIPTEIIRIACIFKGKKVEEWDEVLNRMLKVENPETSVLKSIALSYDSLKPDAKSCFLYLGQFPPDQTIKVEKLYSMWIVEGLVPDKDEAERCFKDLVGRNLVIQNAGVSETGGKSCHLQEMTRKLCMLKGNEEGFFGIPYSEPGNTRSSVNGGRGRSAAVHLNEKLNEDNLSAYFHEAKRSRALLFFGDEGSRFESLWPKMYAESKNFQSTRVLDFDGIDFRAYNFLISIEKLVYLRYLGFFGCCLYEFPFSGCSFPYLETLDLRVRNKVVIPNVLRKMSNLKFLYLPVAFKCYNEREQLKLDGLVKLEILENFHAGICDVNDLQEFKHLHIITIISDGENAHLEKLISNVDVSRRSHPWNKLSLVLNDFDCYTRERQETLKKLLECHGIHTLHLEGYIKRMPGNLSMAQDFTEIVFDGTEFRKDPMPMLGDLQHLKSLVLCNDAITDDKICCGVSSFPELERLEIINLPSLKSWDLDSAAMPKLSLLTIKKCHKLALNEYLVYLPSLRQLKVKSMPKQFIESIRATEVLAEDVDDEMCTIFVNLEDN